MPLWKKFKKKPKETAVAAVIPDPLSALTIALDPDNDDDGGGGTEDNDDLVSILRQADVLDPALLSQVAAMNRERRRSTNTMPATTTTTTTSNSSTSSTNNSIAQLRLQIEKKINQIRQFQIKANTAREDGDLETAKALVSRVLQMKEEQVMMEAQLRQLELAVLRESQSSPVLAESPTNKHAKKSKFVSTFDDGEEKAPAPSKPNTDPNETDDEIAEVENITLTPDDMNNPDLLNELEKLAFEDDKEEEEPQHPAQPQQSVKESQAEVEDAEIDENDMITRLKSQIQHKTEEIQQLTAQFSAAKNSGEVATAKTLGLKINQLREERTATEEKLHQLQVQLVADALKTNPSLQQLTISWDFKIGAEGARQIAESLKCNSFLQQLNISDNNIGAEGASSLADALKVNTFLQQLDISWNSIGEEGAKHIADALKFNTALQQLDISCDNKIGDEGARHFANTLRINTSLQHLGISDNDIGADGARYLADALKTNATLKQLNLSDNIIGTDGARYLADALKINLSLCEMQTDFSLQQTVTPALERNKNPSLLTKYLFKVISGNDKSFVDAIANQLRARPDCQELLNSTNDEGKALHQEALRLGHNSIVSCLKGPKPSVVSRVPPKLQRSTIPIPVSQKETQTRVPTPLLNQNLPQQSQSSLTTMINGFAVLKELGAGGFGKVHLVQRQSSGQLIEGRKFAMKVIPCGNDEAKLNSILNEVNLANQRHPAIVGVEECFLAEVATKLGNSKGSDSVERHACIVMEYCERGDLRHEILRMIQEDRKCDEQVAWKWLRQACSALEFMHLKQMIHRDIKPDNILLSGENPPNIKITDFGISRTLVSDQEMARTQIGTMRYAAPDVSSSEGYDQRVDMWGIGVLFFELLTRGIFVSQEEDVKKGRVDQSKLRPENKDAAPFWSRVRKNPNFVSSCKQAIIDNGYSSEMSDVVSNLMDPDSNKRRTARDVVKFIDDKSKKPAAPVPTKPTNPIPMKNFEINFNELNLIKELGHGGFGVVWLAKWNGRGSGMTVAVKKLLLSESVIQQSQSAGAADANQQISATSRQEFEKEMEMMFSLSFPHVVRIFGACIDPTGPLCIVEEFAERGSLFSILHNPSIPTLEWGLRWRMARQAAMGLNFLHHCDPEILHRDIKSLNFLVDEHWNVKICDFGLAKVRLESSAKAKSLSSSNPQSKPVGTVRWSAPESLDYPPVWSTKSDVYSLGMTMWEIASRQIPFEAIRDDAAIPMVVCLKNRRPEIPADCPPVFSDLIKQCWSADPKDRPACDQILEILNQPHPEIADQPQVAAANPIASSSIPALSSSSLTSSTKSEQTNSSSSSSSTTRNVRSNPPPRPPPKRVEDTRPKFKVVCDFDATTPEELSIREGDIVRVNSQDESGWWEGEVNGKKGFFPGEYVQGPV